jgi:flagellar protein FliL
VPEILVNLNSTGKKETYLKIRISLELENPETQAAIEPMMPRVIDSFQVFLREMRVEDLSGSAGMVRLKEELLNRINLSIQPYKVIDVLFKEMLIQ